MVRFVEDDEIPRVGVQGRFLVPRDLQRVDRRDHLVERLELVDVVALEPFKAAPEALGELDLPLIHEPRRSDDQAAERAAGAVAHDLEDHAGLDGLAEADVIGDEPMAAAVLGGRAREHAVRDDDLVRQHVERLVRDLAGLLVAGLEPAAEDPELERHRGAWSCVCELAGQILDDAKLRLRVPLERRSPRPRPRTHLARRNLLDEAVRRRPRATHRSRARPDLLSSTQPSDVSLCLAAIAEPEAAKFHVARRDLRPSEQVLGRLAEHPVEDVFLLSRGLGERGAESRRRAFPPQPVRAARAYGAGDADGLLGVDDVGRQVEALGEGLDELVRLTIVIEILPALGRSPDDELKEHVKRR